MQKAPPGRGRRGGEPWRAWGPYVSERAWGTVREDYSADGDAWGYFPHDHARSRAYRWNEDGLAGVCDERPDLVPRPGAVERRRPDPQGADLRPDRPRGQPRRGRQGVLVVPRLHADALVDALALPLPAARVPVRRAGHRERPARHGTSPSTSCSTPASSTRTATGTSPSTTPRPARPTCACGHASSNRGPEAATLHVLPTLWFRNTWSWGGPATTHGRGIRSTRTPALVAEHRRPRRGWRLAGRRRARAAVLRQRDQHASGCAASPGRSAYPKDGINDHVVHGAATVNPAQTAPRRRSALRARRARGRQPRDPAAARPRRRGRRARPAAPASTSAARPAGGGRRVLRRS